MGQASTIDPAEAAHFGAQAAEWWNPRGSSAMLHRLNPVRLGYLARAIQAHWGAEGYRPLIGRRTLDVGCGAGLACEPMARLGANVTGIDPAPENIAAARAHAAASVLPIEYRVGGIEDVADRFDLVTAFEVIEHVSDQPAFVAGLAGALAEGGLLVMSTPNRTLTSRLALVAGAETLGLIPRGTHDWHRFLIPEELTELLAKAGLRVTDVQGLGWSPVKGFALGDSTALNYLLTAVRA